jgi:hypothetical protein|nr:hypothetical protein [uncultured Campylobacter sp.]
MKIDIYMGDFDFQAYADGSVGITRGGSSYWADGEDLRGTAVSQLVGELEALIASKLNAIADIARLYDEDYITATEYNEIVRT